MRAALHAVGRSADILPLMALGAHLHEAETLEQAREVVRALTAEAGASASVLILLSEEFAQAEGELPEESSALLTVLPRAGSSSLASLEKTRELVSRSVGVDLIAKSKRMVQRDGRDNR